MNGELSILNIGEGDTKLSFDKSNPQECIRAGRIVRDMLRRGYALLLEVERDGEKKFERALDFDENTSEYIIADFDPVTARKSDIRTGTNDLGETAPAQHQREAISEQYDEQEEEDIGESSTGQADVQTKARKGVRKSRRQRVPADSTQAVSVGRSAGG
jgi:hypothetical protein